MGGVIWNIESAGGKHVMYGLYALGWAIVFAATFLINHSE